ncbi:helix-turn-helix transcriptional regulator [Flagellimonas halotolerans]|uniref:Helix-turn-helix transcriptional regulator n=1 Tax=Flagellimonas halotolerans TaxID=3112164 RepID=A0ABU6IPS3_9FLAO|nr:MULTISPECIES: helix-turn-helix transcriptional regulator [unclassified Allomuricauda]MEC3965134.1 helix-turn-helix transcriptional regulator [Muricauda sp. SYSU M86414]MEC4265021.1 helix-turn-helix transcriptional regulator [Muricauda sp. SYSU M84420]
MITSKSSNESILKELTKRVRQRRLNLNMTQEQLANTTGLHNQTIKNFESGNNTSLLTLIQILRAFGDLAALDKFLPDPGISPIQLLKLKGKERERASGTDFDKGKDSEW